MKQLAALGLVSPPAFQSAFHDVEFHFTHDAFHSQNQAIVDIARIVDAVLVGKQHVADGAEIE